MYHWAFDANDMLEGRTTVDFYAIYIATTSIPFSVYKQSQGAFPHSDPSKGDGNFNAWLTLLRARKQEVDHVDTGSIASFNKWRA